jgi:hypothetical protein
LVATRQTAGSAQGGLSRRKIGLRTRCFWRNEIDHLSVTREDWLAPGNAHSPLWLGMVKRLGDSLGFGGVWVQSRILAPDGAWATNAISS